MKTAVKKIKSFNRLPHAPYQFKGMDSGFLKSNGQNMLYYMANTLAELTLETTISDFANPAF